MITIPKAKFGFITKTEIESLPTTLITSLLHQYTLGAYKALLAIYIDVGYYKGNKPSDEAPLGGLDTWSAFKFAFSTLSGAAATGSCQYSKELLPGQPGSYFFVYGLKKRASEYLSNVTVTYEPANGPAETKNKKMTWK
jgi:hypothetical protein